MMMKFGCMGLKLNNNQSFITHHFLFNLLYHLLLLPQVTPPLFFISLYLPSLVPTFSYQLGISCNFLLMASVCFFLAFI